MAFIADPTAVLDYAINWASWPLQTGETITASTWTVPAGITQTTPAPSFTSTTTTIWLTGGTIGATYRLTNHVTTSGGRQDERSFDVTIADL